MRLSRRSEYGLRALVDLVRHDGEGPVALATLGQRNNLPPKFLEQIMATLKHAGIVRTTLGTHGGYAMAGQASSVSIGVSFSTRHRVMNASQDLGSSFDLIS